VTWSASDGVNAAPFVQNLTVLPALFAASVLDIRDGAKLKTASGGGAYSANAGSNYSRLGGNGASVGSIFSKPNMQSYGGKVSGDVRTAGTYTPFNGAVVTGTVFQGTSVGLPPVPAGVTFAVTGQSITVNSSAVTLSPGTYGDVIINSGAPSPAIILSPGTYRFRSLTSNSSSNIRVTGTSTQRVNVLVSNQLNFRGKFIDGSGNLREVFVGFGGTSTVLEAPFRGTFTAPAAVVEVGAGVTGQLLARDLIVRPNMTVTCASSRTLGNVFDL
jgi:hypothetical protein